MNNEAKNKQIAYDTLMKDKLSDEAVKAFQRPVYGMKELTTKQQGVKIKETGS